MLNQPRQHETLYPKKKKRKKEQEKKRRRRRREEKPKLPLSEGAGKINT